MLEVFANEDFDTPLIRSWICPECGAEHVRDANAAMSLKENAMKQIGQGVSGLMSVEGVERLTELALAFSGASCEAGNLTGGGQNVITII